MSRIIQILIRNHVFFLFILLECISVKILISNHFVAESNFAKKMTKISSEFFKKEKQINEYFFLREIHDSLLMANERLFRRNLSLIQKLESRKNMNLDNIDSIIITQSQILRTSWNKKQNFITINSGATNGVKSNMGVINSDNNLVGITYTTSDHFSTVISLINTNLMISAKVKGGGHYGTLSWDGKNPNTMQLYDIPKHAKIAIGDTVITSGYSNIIPANINIGTITKYKTEKNTNFLNISVALFVDFTNIESVYIMNSLFEQERELIEQK